MGQIDVVKLGVGTSLAPVNKEVIRKVIALQIDSLQWLSVGSKDLDQFLSDILPFYVLVDLLDANLLNSFSSDEFLTDKITEGLDC